jgi:hypothetical protein
LGKYSILDQEKIDFLCHVIREKHFCASLACEVFLLTLYRNKSSIWDGFPLLGLW